MKVKALYHFLDKKACRNRKQGDIFDVPEERAVELEKAGLVVILEPKAKRDIKPAEKPVDPPTNEPPKKQAEAKKDPKKQKK